MKRFTLTVAVAIGVALMALQSFAQSTTTHRGALSDSGKSAAASSPSADSNDWRYVWHEGQWWYWTPKNRWVVWTGSVWVPFDQVAARGATSAQGNGTPYTTFYGSYEGQAAGGYSAPVPSYSAPSYRSSGAWGGSGIGSGGYAGYGWTWGPGTVFPNAPGRRF